MSWRIGNNPSNGGTINGQTSGGPYHCYGPGHVQAAAVPNSGFGFEDWTVSGGSVSSTTADSTTLTIPCPGSAALTANYGSLPVFDHDYTFTSSQLLSVNPVSPTSGYADSETGCIENGTITYNHQVSNSYFNNQWFNATTYWCQYFDLTNDLSVIKVVSVEQQPILYLDLGPSCTDCAAYPSGVATAQLVLWENENPNDPGYHVNYGIGTANFTANSASTGGNFYWWNSNNGPPIESSIPTLNLGDVFNLTSTNQTLATDLTAVASQIYTEGGTALSNGGYERWTAPNATYAYVGTYYQDNVNQVVSDMLASLNQKTYIATNTVLGQLIVDPVNAQACLLDTISVVGGAAVIIATGGVTAPAIAGYFFGGIGVAGIIEGC
ncbi:MAG TPA: hypothetical protein VJN71_02920 [Nitrososphaerales archaeon]|nr:hypothetical protein [Nitrososphaerales archaeon]